MITTSILSGLIYQSTYATKVVPYLKYDYFKDMGERVIFKVIRDHIMKYNECPSKETVRVDLDMLSLKESAYESSIECLDKIKNEPVSVEWLINTTEQFCKRAAFLNALEKGAAMLDKEDTSIYNDMLGVMQDALAVSFDSDLGQDYIEDAGKRFASYEEKEDHLPCDLEIVNRVTLGGFRENTMTVFSAPTGGGKSLFLSHFASAFLLKGKNVLYVTLEMSESQIGERIDANVLDVEINNLKRIGKVNLFTRMNKFKKSVNYGRLKTKYYPAHTINSAHLRHYINELKLKDDFVPDVVMIDYLGLMGSATVARKSVNSYEYQKVVAEELRGLVSEFNARLFTAVQVNRDGTKTGDFEITDTADSWGVPATADYFYGIVSNEELASRGLIRVKRLKDRYNDYTSYITSFMLGIDKPKMRLYDIADNDIEGDNSPPETETKKGNQKRSDPIVGAFDDMVG